MGNPVFLANDLANSAPDWGLRDEVNIGIGVGFPTLAFQNPARLTTT